ncbi:translation initiation factor IF-2 [Leptolyngbya sp. FACHB-711]|uniref:translation initiation factor IF-2 n=1 Tax=unclassified Leptolyngbya TaxID=2650499 RepID=UPI0016865207|nr:translation initiation factor IF-2 [Leptolyngbya sp. FACHB-711]MBD1850663.1 translation initiation factor IF-2 [Cyanobacteria bacterium FACHB-502]MBD2025567.1 translation initiation factor IF-2 [Leptolyngbya sp. FACHB-711]
MNNGKVRIYELSKELNLDNRDILAVCDQLDIAYKSHSSTITEAEAERIRSAAEKYTPNHAVAPRPMASVQAGASQAGASSRPSSIQPPVKKQQILEIRRTRPLAEPPKRAEVETSSASAPATPTADRAPAKLNSPSRPVRSAPADEAAQPSPESIEATIEEVEAPVEIELVQAEAPVEETPQVAAPRPMQSSSSDDGAAPRVESVRAPQPQLSSPPPRPVKAADGSAPNLTNRPVLRKARAEAAEQVEVGAKPVQAREGGVSVREAPRRNDQPGGAGRPESPLRPKPVIELRRKPTRPGEGGDGAETAAKTEDGGIVRPFVPGGEEVRRPTLNRPPKRGKTWEEEEEEEKEAAKTGKAATKTKRRAQPVIDEEDLELEDILDEDELDEDAPIQVSLSLARPPKPKSRPGQQAKPVAAAAPVKQKRSSESFRSRRDRKQQEEMRQRPTEITLTGGLSVHDLAIELAVPETELIRILFMKGIAANINQILDIPTATMVAQEYEIEVKTGEVEAEAKKITEMLSAEDLENLQRRPPVVTIMGHVDHGKTTLLDSIRKTKVAQGEAGGITQHIGAYHVDVDTENGTQQVVFLDTPGHEAFTAMRARGARVTDIAVLVVAADDGVRPQTIEAISHAKAAEVPIVVAINKVDKEGAQPDRVKQELTEFSLVPEEWGGETIMVPVSALQGDNLDTLLEMLLLVAEVEDLYANPDRTAKGTVIEAHLDKARGPVATLLVQNGTLRVGDVLVAGSTFGKVRAMIDDRLKRVDAATPSFAVEVLGLSDVPAAGDDFEVYRDEKEARAVAGSRLDQQRQSRLQQAMASRRVSLNTISAQAQEGDLKELNLILKADVQGSVEAILGALQQLPQKEVQVRVLLAAPGEITETDVDLAAASSAVIVGFNTTLASGARQAADGAGVDVRDYNIIYKLLEDIQGAMEGLLEPEQVEEPLGQAEVRAVFTVGRGAVAGCYILSGKAIRNTKMRVRRRNDVVFEGNLDSLKRVKDDVKEVNAGYECGIGSDSFRDWQNGDIIEVFRLVAKRRSLSA